MGATAMTATLTFLIAFVPPLQAELSQATLAPGSSDKAAIVGKWGLPQRERDEEG